MKGRRRAHEARKKEGQPDSLGLDPGLDDAGHRRIGRYGSKCGCSKGTVR